MRKSKKSKSIKENNKNSEEVAPENKEIQKDRTNNPLNGENLKDSVKSNDRSNEENQEQKRKVSGKFEYRKLPSQIVNNLTEEIPATKPNNSRKLTLSRQKTDTSASGGSFIEEIGKIRFLCRK